MLINVCHVILVAYGGLVAPCTRAAQGLPQIVPPEMMLCLFVNFAAHLQFTFCLLISFTGAKRHRVFKDHRGLG